MLYNQIKGKEGDAVVACFRTMGAVIQGFEQIFPNDAEELEYLNDMKRIISDNFVNWGGGHKTMKQNEKIVAENREFLIKKYNAPQSLHISPLGIEYIEKKEK